MNLTRTELAAAQRASIDDPTLPATVHGVTFERFVNSIAFRYGNATGLVFPDNGYLGPQPDGRSYYLLWKLSCRYSDASRFNPSFAPGLVNAASAVVASWDLFTRP